MKARECPYCHKKVSVLKCTFFLLRGTAYSIRCNHCGNSISPSKEPIPFNACVVAGFLSIFLPMQFCLYYLHMGFLDSLMCALPIFLLLLAAVIILTLCRIKFKRDY